MPGSLIPLVVAGVVLAVLGILLWLGARERRQLSAVHDAQLGDLKLFRTYWVTAAPMLLGQERIPVSGAEEQHGPTDSQKRTLEFVKGNFDELAKSAIGAARKAVTAAKLTLQTDDFRVSAIFLHKDLNSFELSVDSESCAAAMPDGIAVSFTGTQVNEVEFVH